MPAYERLNTSGFLFTQTKVAVNILSGDFGDGFAPPSAVIGNPSGLRGWTIRIDALPDSNIVPLIEGKTRADYLWDFFVASKAAGNKPFWVEDPKTDLFYLASFTDDEISYEILCSKVYSTGLTLRQRRVSGQVSPIDSAVPDFVARWKSDEGVYTDAEGTIPAAAHRDRVRAWRDTVNGALLATNSSHAGGYLELASYVGGKGAVRFERVIGSIRSGLTSALVALGLSKTSYTVAIRWIPLDGQPGALISPDDNNGTFLYLTQDYIRLHYQSYVKSGGAVNILDWLSPEIFPDTGSNGVAETVIWRQGAFQIRLNAQALSEATAAAPDAGSAVGITVGDGWSGGGYGSRVDVLELRIYDRELSDSETATVIAEMGAIAAPARRFDLSKPLLIVDGNSLATNFGTGILFPWPALMQVQATGAHIVNHAIAGATTAEGGTNLTATFNDRFGDILAGPYPAVIVIMQELTNDLFINGGDGSAPVANLRAYALAIKGANPDAKICVATMLPNVHLVDAGLETARLNANAGLRAYFSGTPAATGVYSGLDPTADGMDFMIDLTVDADVGDPGDYTDTDFYADGAHLTAAGHERVYPYFAAAAELCGLVFDGTPPSLIAAEFAGDSTTLTLTFDEPVSPVSNPTLSLSGGGATASYSSGAGTSALVYTASRTIASGETGILDMASGAVIDAASNPIAAISGFALTELEYPGTLSPQGWWTAGPATTYTDDAGTVQAADGEAVANVLDRSGNNHPWTQTSSGSRPVLTLSGGLYRLRFDGSDDFMAFDGAALSGLTAAEIWVVLRKTSSGDMGLWDVGNSGAADYYDFSANIYDSFGSNARRNYSHGVDLTQMHVYRVAANGSGRTVWLDSVQLGTDGTNTVAWKSSPKIGRNNLLTYGAQDWCEVVLFDRLLSSGERSAMLAWAQAKWGTP